MGSGDHAAQAAALTTDGDAPTTTVAAGVPRVREGPLVAGQSLGRYVVLQPVGSGGMSMVYAAYDPELDRRIALKMVRPRASEGPRSGEDRRRLVREAQAMARLSHWNPGVRADLGRGLADLPRGADAWSRVEPRIAKWVEHWSGQARDACEAHLVGRTQSGELYDARMRCLDDARTALVSRLALLGAPDRDVVVRATSLVDGLPDVQRCGDLERLAEPTPLPTDPARRDAIAAVAERAAELEAWADAGRHHDASPRTGAL